MAQQQQQFPVHFQEAVAQVQEFTRACREQHSQCKTFSDNVHHATEQITTIITDLTAVLNESTEKMNQLNSTVKNRIERAIAKVRQKYDMNSTKGKEALVRLVSEALPQDLSIEDRSSALTQAIERLSTLKNELQEQVPNALTRSIANFSDLDPNAPEFTPQQGGWTHRGVRKRSKRTRRRSTAGTPSKTHLGRKNYTTKYGSKVFHRRHHYVRKKRKPYTKKKRKHRRRH